MSVMHSPLKERAIALPHTAFEGEGAVGQVGPRPVKIRGKLGQPANALHRVSERYVCAINLSHSCLIGLFEVYEKTLERFHQLGGHRCLEAIGCGSSRRRGQPLVGRDVDLSVLHEGYLRIGRRFGCTPCLGNSSNAADPPKRRRRKNSYADRICANLNRQTANGQMNL